jgi:hypothetical protein
MKKHLAITLTAVLAGSAVPARTWKDLFFPEIHSKLGN